jgi:hypothetical protein
MITTVISNLLLDNSNLTTTGGVLFVDNEMVVYRSQTGQFVSTSVTGNQFYPSVGNPSGFITGFNSGIYITTGQTGAFGGGSLTPTGNLTGAFYPLTSNPSGYITSGQTGAFGGGANTGALINVFYPLNSNPSGYLTSYNQSGSFIFSTPAVSGVIQQFITFPSDLGNNPYVIANLNNNSGSNGIFMQVSGVLSNGYWATYSDAINSNDYYITTLASLSSSTGLATTIVNINRNITGFSTLITSGIDTQYINFPSLLSYSPCSITCEIENNIDNVLYQHLVNSVTNSGFKIYFSDNIGTTGYKLYTTICW